MSEPKYVSFAGEAVAPLTDMQTPDMPNPPLFMSGDVIPNSIFTAGNWYTEDCEIPGMVKHDSGELIMLMGCMQCDPKLLYGEFEIQIGNDVLSLTNTAIIYIPAGVAHGNIKVKNVLKPFFYVTCHSDTDQYHAEPAEPTEPVGTYANNYTESYDMHGVKLPPVKDGAITRLFYMDSDRVPGAPYTEAVWWPMETPAFLKAHTHQLDELVTFIGGDPNDPEDLKGQVTFYVDGEPIVLQKTCVLYIPQGIPHTPFSIDRVDTPILHFSGGNNSNYSRED